VKLECIQFDFMFSTTHRMHIITSMIQQVVEGMKLKVIIQIQPSLEMMIDLEHTMQS
jgi:hypothetical protein